MTNERNANQRSGFDMTNKSIVGKDYNTVVGYYNACDHMKYWGKREAFWGGIWGMLSGAAFFAVPGIGPVLAAGPLVAWIIGAPEGAVVAGGLSVLGAGLYSIAIPKNSVVKTSGAQIRQVLLALAQRTRWPGRRTSCRTHSRWVAVHATEREQPPVVAAAKPSIG